jgi:hypothetical protein
MYREKQQPKPMQAKPAKQRVVATYEMDTATFARHFTHRHPQSLGGMKQLPENLDYNVEQTYRAYHWRLHGTSARLSHYHDPDPPEAGIDRAIECLIENRDWGWHEIAGIKGHIAAFPNGQLATRINGVIKHHQTIEDATDRLVKQNA